MTDSSEVHHPNQQQLLLAVILRYHQPIVSIVIRFRFCRAHIHSSPDPKMSCADDLTVDDLNSGSTTHVLERVSAGEGSNSNLWGQVDREKWVSLRWLFHHLLHHHYHHHPPSYPPSIRHQACRSSRSDADYAITVAVSRVSTYWT